MKILIVDDEMPIRCGIAGYLRAQLEDACEIESAQSAREAMNLIEGGWPVDLLLTDVLMPDIDGIQLAEWTRRQLPDASIIVVSGSDDFQHVKSSIRFQAEDYLLKPIKPDQLLNCVRAAMSKRDERKCEARKKAEQEALILEMAPELSAQLLRGLMKNQFSEESVILRRMEMLGLKELTAGGELQVALAEVYGDIAARPVLLKALRHCFDDCMVVSMDGDEIAVVMQISDGQGPAYRDEQRARLEKELEPGINWKMGLGCKVPSPMQLARAYRSARLALNQGRMELGGGHLIMYGDINISDARACPRIARDQEMKLLQAIQAGDEAQMIACVEAIFAYLTPCVSAFDPLLLANVKMEWIASIMWIMKNMELSSENAPTLNDLDIHRAISVTQLCALRAWVIEKLHLLINYLKQERGNRACRIVTRMKEAADTRYSEPFGVQQFADELDVSPNYLSTLFKQAVGVTFTDYIRSVRLSKAAELMRLSTMRISDIARQVGYEDQNYFARVFRKQFGASPSEYRERM